MFHAVVERAVVPRLDTGQDGPLRRAIAFALSGAAHPWSVGPTLNQVIRKRMVKRQQMRWSPRGAHLLLQVRTRVLNEELRSTFGSWYVGFDTGAREQEEPQAA